MRKLYKFRPLGDCESLERLEGIIRTKKFWCSRFWEMNDPMEGVFSTSIDQADQDALQDIFGSKGKYVTCSLSARDAFAEPAMWGYYANGFQGVAIEIVVENAQNIEEIVYKPASPHVQRHVNPKTLLTTKLDSWKHEREFRFLVEGKPGPYKIGKLSCIYFGWPYRGISNIGQLIEFPPNTECTCNVPRNSLTLHGNAELLDKAQQWKMAR